MIDVKNVKLVDILPNNLAVDPVVKAAAETLDKELSKVTKLIEKCSILANIEELPEEVLDLLAWEEHVDFYDIGLPLAKKQALVKQSPGFHKRKGTPSAVEDIVAALFHKSRVEEWWEYGGQPYHFRVVISDADDEVKVSNLTAAINTVKRLSARLEAIIFMFERTATINTYQFQWNFSYPLCNRVYMANKQGKLLPTIIKTASRDRSWIIDYPLCNIVKTQGIRGRIKKELLKFNTNNKYISITYPLCGQVITGEMSA